jgi:O-antigen/teichoic acid export membrane protein
MGIDSQSIGAGGDGGSAGGTGVDGGSSGGTSADGGSAANGRKVVPQRDTLWLSGADAVNLFFGVVIHIVLTRALLSDSYGKFVLLLDFFHVCVILVDLGLPTLIGRDGGRLGNRLPSFIKRVGKVQVKPTLVLVLLIHIAVFALISKVESEWLIAAFLLLMSAIIQVFTYSFRAGLRAMGEARAEAVVRIVDRGAVAMLMWFWAGDLVDFSVATVVGPMLSFAVAIGYVQFVLAPRLGEPDENLPETADMDNRELMRTALPFLIAGAALVINVRIEKLLLGVFATPADVAIFQIAWLGFIAGYGPVLSLRAVLTSWFGEVRNDLEKLTHRYKKAFFATAILAPIGVGIGLLVGPFALEALFPEYAELAEKPFLTLLIAWLFHTMASPSLALIQVGEKPWNYTRILWLGILLSTATCVMLLPTQSDAAGSAAIAACCGALFVFALAFTSVKSGLTGVEPPQSEGSEPAAE